MAWDSSSPVVDPRQQRPSVLFHHGLLALSLLFSGACSPEPAGSLQDNQARLQFVTTVRQRGPVGYRDPLGFMSPDGVWLAYTTGTRLRFQRVAGGAVRDLGSGGNNVSHISWLPDSRTFAAREVPPDRGTARWFLYDIEDGGRRPLWEQPQLEGTLDSGIDGAPPTTIADGELTQLAWAPDGKTFVGLAPGQAGSMVWIFDADGGSARIRLSDKRLTFPAWRPDSSGFDCLSRAGDVQLIDPSCSGGEHVAEAPEAYGPLAYSTDGRSLYYGSPNEEGTLDLWARDLGTGRAEQLTHFDRDTYGATVGADGSVLFKTQDYRVFIAVSPAGGGATSAVTTFQSETPSWDWDSRSIAFTYGTWRRAIDDINYPDIAQNIGFVRLGEGAADVPGTVVRSSYSEDQGMHWSPNGKWIVFHTHADGSDDVWLQPADGSSPARQLSFDGYETGWPRWSPDGRWIVYPSMVPEGSGWRGVLFVVGIDQESGQVTGRPRQLDLGTYDGEPFQAEWAPDSERLVFEGYDGGVEQGIYVVSRQGGTPERVHTFESDQIFSGMSVSPDFQWAAYIAPAPDGYFQIFRAPMSGGPAVQLTFDPSDKTQPAYSPDGEQLAFTVFSYLAHFWLLQESDH